MPNYSSLLDVALELADIAEAEIMPRFRRLDPGQIAAKSGPMDLVTEADTSAEAMITRALQSAFPSAVIVGEEEDDVRLIGRLAGSEW